LDLIVKPINIHVLSFLFFQNSQKILLNQILVIFDFLFIHEFLVLFEFLLVIKHLLFIIILNSVHLYLFFNLFIVLNLDPSRLKFQQLQLTGLFLQFLLIVLFKLHHLFVLHDRNKKFFRLYNLVTKKLIEPEHKFILSDSYQTFNNFELLVIINIDDQIVPDHINLFLIKHYFMDILVTDHQILQQLDLVFKLDLFRTTIYHLH